MFFHNHNTNLVAGTNNLLVYVDGIPSVEAQSIVYELKLPETYDSQKNFNNELEVIWSFMKNYFQLKFLVQTASKW